MSITSRRQSNSVVKNGKIAKRTQCPNCPITLSRRADLNRHMRALHGDRSLGKPFKCTFPGCRYSDYQRYNVTVHSGTHDETKSRKCEWEKTLIGTPCDFVCSDPSSLNRHTRRHVSGAILAGKEIPPRYKKYEGRVRAELGMPLNTSSGSSSASPVPDVKVEVVADSILEPRGLPLAAAETSTSIIQGMIPITTRDSVSEQPQDQQNYPRNTSSNGSSTGFSSGAMALQDQQTLQLQRMQDQFTILMKRIQQLTPILTRSQRPLSKDEIKGAISYAVRCKDGFDPDRFFTSGSTIAMSPAY